MTFVAEYAAAEPSRADIKRLPGPVVLEFGTPWCGFCTAAQPLIEASLSRFPEVRHIKVEDGRGRPLGRSFRIKLWPTLVFLRDGEEVGRVTRPTDAAPIGRFLESIRQEPGPAAPGGQETASMGSPPD
jgi:thioredoxin 1